MTRHNQPTRSEKKRLLDDNWGIWALRELNARGASFGFTAGRKLNRRERLGLWIRDMRRRLADWIAG